MYTDLTTIDLLAYKARLEEALRWGQEHPYAGHCGEDDRLGDELEAVEEALKARAQDVTA